MKNTNLKNILAIYQINYNKIKCTIIYRELKPIEYYNVIEVLYFLLTDLKLSRNDIEQNDFLLFVPVGVLKKLRPNLNELKKLKELCNSTNLYYGTDQIVNIYLYCKKKNIEFKYYMLEQKYDISTKIIDACLNLKISIEKEYFVCEYNHFLYIIDFCSKNDLLITPNIIRKSPKELNKFKQICNDNNLNLTNKLLDKSSVKLLNTIRYIKENYGDKYVRENILKHDLLKLQKTMPYLNQYSLLPYVINDDYILSLSPSTIKKRWFILNLLGESIIVENKFNWLLSLSEEEYLRYLNKVNFEEYKSKVYKK